MQAQVYLVLESMQIHSLLPPSATELYLVLEAERFSLCWTCIVDHDTYEVV